MSYCVGFSSGNSYEVYIPEQNRVIVSRDVQFDEGAMEQPADPETGEPSDFEHVSEEMDIPSIQQIPTPSGTDEEMSERNESVENQGSIVQQPVDTINAHRDPLTHYPGLRRSTRI